jgi:hypothetical protein
MFANRKNTPLTRVAAASVLAGLVSLASAQTDATKHSTACAGAIVADDLPRVPVVLGDQRDDGSVIDLLVVYTGAALENSGSEAVMVARINEAVAQANEVYANSGINFQLNLVYVQEITYDEAGGYLDHLERLISPSDGVMDEVHALRDEFGADLVSLFVRDVSQGGIARLMQELSPAFERDAFSVVQWFDSPEVLVHELGHNMGACHAFGDEGLCGSGEGLFPFSNGYWFNGNDGDLRRTVMAVGELGMGIPIRNFSNPDILVNGQPTGATGEDTSGADNARTLNASASTVANFRSLDIPCNLGVFDTPDCTWDVKVVGATAYIVDRQSGLHAIDVSNPSSPTLLGSFDTPHLARGLAMVGTTAFVADTDTGLVIVDMSDPGNTEMLGSVVTPGNANAVAVDGDTAYVADRQGGLQIIDVSDLSSPEIVGSFGTQGDARDVEVADGVAFVADQFFGTRIIDVSDPATPVELSFVGTGSQAQGVDLLGSMLYVADWEAGLVVFDVSDPAAPVFMDSVDTPDQAMNVSVVGNFAYVADQLGGLQIIDVSDPMDLFVAGSFAMPEPANGVAVVGQTAFVATRYSGLQIVVDTSGDCDGNEGVCLADLTSDGVLDVFDIQAFLAAFSVMHPSADWNGDGVFDFFDVILYLEAYSRGCG